MGAAIWRFRLRGIDQTYLREGLVDWRQGSLEGGEAAEVEAEVDEGAEMGERVEVDEGVEAEAGEGSRVAAEEEHSFLTGNGELNEEDDELDIFFE